MQLISTKLPKVILFLNFLFGLLMSGKVAYHILDDWSSRSFLKDADASGEFAGKIFALGVVVTWVILSRIAFKQINKLREQTQGLIGGV